MPKKNGKAGNEEKRNGKTGHEEKKKRKKEKASPLLLSALFRNITRWPCLDICTLYPRTRKVGSWEGGTGRLRPDTAQSVRAQN